MKGLDTEAENTWCPGCGNFGILRSFKKAVNDLEEKGVERGRMIITTDIGCNGKIFDYLGLSGLYSIHGRAVAAAQGIKLGNPGLAVTAFSGDGGALGEGIAHLVFAAKRNADITVIVHDNGAYSLTTGQFSPTSGKGFKGPSTPGGSVEPPLNPLTLMMECGASFVARGYSGNIEHLSDLVVRGIEHQGFSFIDVLQPSVVFSTKKYQEYNEVVEAMEETPKDIDEARKLAQKKDELPIGVFRKDERPPYHKELIGGLNPVRGGKSRGERADWIKRMTST